MKTKGILIIAVIIIMICSTVFAITFTDINAEHWAYEYVTDLVGNNVINGYPDGTFKPEGTISKAEFLKLVISASLPEGVDYNQIPTEINHWAGQYLYITETYGIVQRGVITLQNIDTPITRIDMALIIAKSDVILKMNKMDTTNEITFADNSEMDASQIRWLTHAVNRGLIKGYTDNTFKPSNNMTRAEAATMIYRLTR